MIPDSSTRDQKVTKPDFRPCSACMPHSQAPLCLCTLRLISIQPEGTFGRLRYSLGTDVRSVDRAHQALTAVSFRSLGRSDYLTIPPRDVRRVVVRGHEDFPADCPHRNAFSLSP